jgi:hypothetical protein
VSTIPAICRNGPLANRVMEVDYQRGTRRFTFPMARAPRLDFAEQVDPSAPVPVALDVVEYEVVQVDTMDWANRDPVLLHLSWLKPAELRRAERLLNERRKHWGVPEIAFGDS